MLSDSTGSSPFACVGGSMSRTVLTFATALCHSLRRWPTDSALLAMDCVLLRALAIRGAQRPRRLRERPLTEQELDAPGPEG